MRLNSPKRALRIALPTLAALGAGATVGMAAIPSADGTIHACIRTTRPAGAVRIIDAEANPAEQASRARRRSSGTSRARRGRPGRPGRRARRARQGDQGQRGADGLAGATTTTDNSSSSGNNFSTPSQAGGPSADMFLKLDGIAGESTDDKHKNEIALYVLRLRGGPRRRRHGHLGRHAGAAGTKGRLQTLRIDKVYDAASPKLFRAATTASTSRARS